VQRHGGSIKFVNTVCDVITSVQFNSIQRAPYPRHKVKEYWKILSFVKGKGRVVPVPKHCIMKMYRWSGGEAPHILNLGTRWSWIVVFLVVITCSLVIGYQLFRGHNPRRSQSTEITYFNVQTQYLSGDTEKNMKNLLGQMASGPSFQTQDFTYTKEEC
jgi:hypothetical protein